MNLKNKTKTFLSTALSVIMLFSAAPITTFAAQSSSDYIDPADHWTTTGNRANELDANATVTQETQGCGFCQRETLQTIYRVPEYTKSGETALNRGVRYSDGTLMSGEGQGNLDDGMPGVDAYYTGYHWSATRS